MVNIPCAWADLPLKRGTLPRVLSTVVVRVIPVCVNQVFFSAESAVDLARRERSLMTAVPSHETTTRNLVIDTHKTMMCSSVTVEMAAFWLVFSQVFWKHFRSSQTTVHPISSLS